MVLYAGIDVHKEKRHGVITDADGKILKNGTFEGSDYGAQNFFGRNEDVGGGYRGLLFLEIHLGGRERHMEGRFPC